MNPHALRAAHPSRPRSAPPREPRLLLAREPESPWAALAFEEDVPPAGLGDARARRDELRALLSRERAAAADFLLALADFDRRRGWERLGHASLFAFLTRELGLSAGAAQLRLSAARLLPRHPAVEAALRDGRLCLSAAGQLARVLTAANEAEVLHRFFGRSSREAQEVAAAIRPAPVPARWELLTSVRAVALAPGAGTPGLMLPLRSGSEAGGAPASAGPGAPLPPAALLLPGQPVPGFALVPRSIAEPPAPGARPVPGAPLAPVSDSPTAPAGGPSLHAHEVGARTCAPRSTPQVVPLTADLRRLHLTVTAGFLEKVAKARTGLSHALPGATTEQVLEAALAALLEKQARRKGLGKRAVRAVTSGASATSSPSFASMPAASLPAPPMPLVASMASAGSPPLAAAVPLATSPRTLAPIPDRPDVPAALERAVRLRDGDRCQFPLDSGGVCGSTWQVELDHVLPVALGGETSLPNLRCLCRVHNQAAAREQMGPAVELRRPKG